MFEWSGHEYGLPHHKKAISYIVKSFILKYNDKIFFIDVTRIILTKKKKKK